MRSFNYPKFIARMKEIAREHGAEKALIWTEIYLSIISAAEEAQRFWELSDEETGDICQELQDVIARLSDIKEEEENRGEGQ